MIRVADEERGRETRDRFLAQVVGAQDLEARRMTEVLNDDVVQRLTALALRMELGALRTGQESLLCRVAQEALANVLRHASAERVTVGLCAAGGLLRCEVTDDGVGFDPQAVATAVNRGSLGLHVVRERVELVGGRLEPVSAPGDGTRFTFELPLAVVAGERAATRGEAVA